MKFTSVINEATFQVLCSLKDLDWSKSSKVEMALDISRYTRYVRGQNYIKNYIKTDINYDEDMKIVN